MKEIAILMAAGMGARMKPLTDTIAKPLVKVCGVSLIETVIHALERRRVDDIYVVIGYKAEQFEILRERYPKIQLVYNVDYETKNNINSIAVVAEKMAEANCFVCEADLFVSNAEVLCGEIPMSGYFGKMVNGFSNDWVFETDSKGLITRVGKGGTDCFNMVGISYFKQPDASKIAKAILEEVKRPENANLFWDEVVDRLVKQGMLNLMVHQVSTSDVVECDTIDELKALEASIV